MEISGRGRSVDLAAILLGIHEPEPRTMARTARSAPPREDHVEISPHAKEMQRIKAMVQVPDPEREARVERIKAAVESGTYSPGPKAVADAVIKHVLLESVL